MLRAFHPTKRALTETVMVLMETKAPNQITTEEILEKSGISKGSMYHHFADLDDLIETALLARYAKWIDASIEFMYENVLPAKSKDELRAALFKLTELTQIDSRKAARAERALALSMCNTNLRMAERMGEETKRLTAAIADITEEVRNKGFLKPTVDSKTLATFIQAYTLGKIVNDHNPDGVAEEQWVNFIMEIAESAWLN